MVGQQFANLDHLEQFGVNLKGNVKAGFNVTPLDFAASEQKRAELFARFAKFFEQYDLLITPQSPVKQFPVEMNFPTLINGKKLDNYTDWIAGSFLITLMSLPGGSVPAGQTSDGLPVGIQIVGPAFRRAADPVSHEDCAADTSRRLAASRLSRGDPRGKIFERNRWPSEQPAQHVGIALEAVARIGAKHFCQCLARVICHAGTACAGVPSFSTVSASARTGFFSARPNASAISIWLSGGVPTSS
ncbi:MAG: amidase family protein [Bradyrhizobium sp.]